MCKRIVELIALVGHLAQAYVRRAHGRQRLISTGGIERLPASPDGRVQVAATAPELAEQVTPPGCDGGLAGPSGDAVDAGFHGPLGLGEPAAEPLRHAEIAPRDILQQPLI